MLAGGCVGFVKRGGCWRGRDRPGVEKKEADRLSCEGQTLSYMCVDLRRSMAKVEVADIKVCVGGGSNRWAAVKLRER